MQRERIASQSVVMLSWVGEISEMTGLCFWGGPVNGL